MEKGVDHFRQADRFLITLDGIEAAQFREVKGLEVRIPVEEYEEGGLNDHSHKLPHQARFSTILLRRGSSDSTELFDWIQQAMRGELVFRTGSIMAVDRQDVPILIWEFRKAWPCRYVGSPLDRTSKEMHIETLELSHHGFTMRRGGGGSMRGPLPSSPAAAASKTPAQLPSAQAQAQARASQIYRDYKETWKGVPRSERPPYAYPKKTAAVVDPLTGETFYGTSGPPSPDPVHPALEEARPGESLEEGWEVDNCAEQEAANNMLMDRQRRNEELAAAGKPPAYPETLEGAEMHTVYTDEKKPGQHKPAAMCKNCQHTFGGQGMDVTSG